MRNKQFSIELLLKLQELHSAVKGIVQLIATFIYVKISDVIDAVQLLSDTNYIE